MTGQNGGANNAYTSENITAYTNFFPSSALEVIFDLEADRIAYLNFDTVMIESERGVILSERTTGVENNPLEQLWQEMQATAFIAHPYMWPVIGWESDIKNWTKQDLENYFHTYYAPNNCLVVISGDVKLNEIKELAEKYWEPIPAGPKPRAVHTVEPPQTGERKVFVKREVPTPYLMITYHVPQAGSNDYYALDLLSPILSQGRSSRLYSSLVEENQIALEVGTIYGDAFDPTLFYFYGVCKDGVKASELETAILDEVQKIIDEGINENELQKVKNQKLMLRQRLEQHQRLDLLLAHMNNIRFSILKEAQRVDGAMAGMREAVRAQLRQTMVNAQAWTQALMAKSPALQVHRDLVIIPQVRSRLIAAVSHSLKRKAEQTHAYLLRFNSLNPLAILDRGYGILETLPGRRTIRDAGQVSVGEEILARLARVQIRCTVEEVRLDPSV